MFFFVKKIVYFGQTFFKKVYACLQPIFSSFSFFSFSIFRFLDFSDAPIWLIPPPKQVDVYESENLSISVTAAANPGPLR